jgi:hypothetical protein
MEFAGYERVAIRKVNPLSVIAASKVSRAIAPPDEYIIENYLIKFK